jgi:hypothetical protein
MPGRRNVVHGASEDRLQKLMSARLQPAADKEEIGESCGD